MSRAETVLRRLRRALWAVAVALVLAAIAAGCGSAERSAERGCVIVDISGSSRPLITSTYLPGFKTFVQRIAKKGTGQVCFAFVGAGSTGGANAVAKFSCPNKNDRLRCPEQIDRNVEAAAQQLSATAEGIATAPGPNAFKGATQLLETIATVAPATRPGDEILVMSDALQDSGLTGDFNSGETLSLDDPSIERILDKLRTNRLLPDLHGRTLWIPYPLVTAGDPLTISPAHRQRIKRFYELYAEATGAELMYETAVKEA